MSPNALSPPPSPRVAQSPHPPQGQPPASPSAKADQIVHRLFHKLVLVVADARATTPILSNDPASQGLITTARPLSGTATASRGTPPPRAPKADKWFNLETADLEQYKPTLAVYKSISTTYPASSVPPLHISIVLSVPSSVSSGGASHGPGPNPALVLVHNFSRRGPDGTQSPPRVTRVTPAPKYILLETHTLALSTTASQSASSLSNIELPQVYKQAITLFRSLYTLLRVLPSWKVHRKLRKKGLPSAGTLALEVYATVGRPFPVDDDLTAGFDAPLSQPNESLLTESIAFPPIPTPLGAFTLRTMYRSHPHYALESLESLLSTHFLSPTDSQTSLQLAGPGPRRDDLGGMQFTPTITSAKQRDRHISMTGGSGSSPRSPLPAPNFPSSSRPRTTSNTPLLRGSPASGASPISAGAASGLGLHNRTRTVSNMDDTGNSSLSSSPRAQGNLTLVRQQQLQQQQTPPSNSLRPPSSLGSSAGTGGTGGMHEFPQLRTPPRAFQALPSSLSASGAITAGAIPTGRTSPAPRLNSIVGAGGVPDLPFAVGLGSGRTSGTMDRTRKESLISNSGVPPSPGGSASIRSGMGIPVNGGAGRRPSINSIHPFKSATVASSPSSHSIASIRQQSPLSTHGPPTPALPASNTTVKRTPGSPELNAQAQTPTALPVPTKRYSSSFNHRHTSSGASILGATGADGGSSVGSGGRLPVAMGSLPRALAGGEGSSFPSSNSPLSAPIKRNTSEFFAPLENDDSELSDLLKLIDGRAPLRGGQGSPMLNEVFGEEDEEVQDEEGEDAGAGSKDDEKLTTDHRPSPGLDADGTRTARSGGVVTSRDEVDETLRKMTESFHAGIGNIRRERAASVAAAVASGLPSLPSSTGASTPSTDSPGSSVPRRPMRTMTVTEEPDGLGSSASGIFPSGPMGRGVVLDNRLSSSSLLPPTSAGSGRGGYDSDQQQVVGKIEMTGDNPTSKNAKPSSHLSNVSARRPNSGSGTGSRRA